MTQKEIIEKTRTWYQLYSFIEKIWLFDFTKTTIHLHFKVSPAGNGLDTDEKTWIYYVDNFRNELSQFGTIRVPIREASKWGISPPGSNIYSPSVTYTLIAFATSLAEMRMRPWMRSVRIKPLAIIRLTVF